jgi:hypothetical protein
MVMSAKRFKDNPPSNLFPVAVSINPLSPPWIKCYRRHCELSSAPYFVRLIFSGILMLFINSFHNSLARRKLWLTIITNPVRAELRHQPNKLPCFAMASSHPPCMIAPTVKHDILNLALKVFDIPGCGRKKFSWKTFKSWLRTYLTEGFDNLNPKTRADKGNSRMVADYLAKVIQQKYQQFPFLNVASLYRMLVDEGYIQNGIPCEAMLRDYIQQHQLKSQSDPPQSRKKNRETACQ